MTEKRFTLSEDKYNETIFNKGIAMGIIDVVEKLNGQYEENKQLKQQLLYDGDDVCGICKHEYLTPSGDYFIGKCEKGHEECSKEDIKYCEDFELKGDVE